MKSKKKSIETYKEKYCAEKIIRNRRQLYVSEKVHETMNSIANLFRDDHTTATSLVDAILMEHINTYREMLNEESDRQKEEFLENFNRITSRE